MASRKFATDAHEDEPVKLSMLIHVACSKILLYSWRSTCRVHEMSGTEERKSGARVCVRAVTLRSRGARRGAVLALSVKQASLALIFIAITT